MKERSRAAIVVLGALAALAIAFVIVKPRLRQTVEERPEVTVRDGERPRFVERSLRPRGSIDAGELEIVDLRTERVLDQVRDIEAALSSSDPSVREEAVESLLAELVRVDPRSAATLATSWEEGPLREQLMQRVAQLWAAADPAGAIEWVAQLNDESDRTGAGASLCLELAETDPADAVRVAQLLGLRESGEEFVALVEMWAAQDLLGALGWALQRRPGTERDQLLARVAVVQAELQPAQAAQLVETQMTDGPTQSAAMVDVMQRWASQDPEGAAAGASRLRDEALRKRVQDELGRLDGDAQPVLVE